MSSSKDQVQCDECFKWLALASIKAHKDRHEGIIHPCEFCSKVYANRSSLSSHRNTAHLGGKSPSPKQSPKEENSTADEQQLQAEIEEIQARLKEIEVSKKYEQDKIARLEVYVEQLKRTPQTL